MKEEGYNIEFGKRLKDLVSDLGLSASDFATAIGRGDSSYISKIYRGERMPKVDFLIHVSKTFPDFDFDHLLFNYKKLSTAELVNEPENSYDNRRKMEKYKALYEQTLRTLEAKEEIIGYLTKK